MDDEDKFEGDVSRRRAKHTPHTGSIFRPPSAASSKRVSARARAAWYNRSRGAGAVKLKHERPAGCQRVVVKIHPKVHAKAATPIALPTWRASIEADVTTPSRRCSTEFCTATISVGIVEPMPRPKTKSEAQV